MKDAQEVVTEMRYRQHQEELAAFFTGVHAGQEPFGHKGMSPEEVFDGEPFSEEAILSQFGVNSIHHEVAMRHEVERISRGEL